MALKPDMKTTDWNRYYTLMAVALFSTLIIKGGDIFPEKLLLFFEVMAALSVTTLAFIQEPRRKKTNLELEHDEHNHNYRMRQRTSMD